MANFLTILLILALICIFIYFFNIIKNNKTKQEQTNYDIFDDMFDIFD